jgi:hypothetical protein
MNFFRSSASVVRGVLPPVTQPTALPQPGRNPPPPRPGLPQCRPQSPTASPPVAHRTSPPGAPTTTMRCRESPNSCSDQPRATLPYSSHKAASIPAPFAYLDSGASHPPGLPRLPVQRHDRSPLTGPLLLSGPELFSADDRRTGTVV